MDKLFARFANVTARATGSPPAFLICVGVVLAWAVSGPIFRFSETWQLVINTGTTIVTFLMVFLIQNTQNRDSLALQTKLDELIRASTEAEDAFIGIEKLTDKELEALHGRCKARAERHIQAVERLSAEKAARTRRKTSKRGSKPTTRKSPSRRSKALRAGHPHDN